MLLLPHWPDLSLRTKCLLLITFPAAATVLLFGFASLLVTRNSAAAREVNDALAIAREIQSLRAADAESSAAARAFLLTSDETFAKRTRASLAALDAARLELIRLSAPVPAFGERLAAIASVEHGREERIFRITERFRAGILSADRLRAELNAAEQDRSHILAFLESIDRDNRRRQAAALRRVDELRIQQRAVTGLCLSLGLAGCIAMTLLFARGITSRIAAVERNVARLAAGQAPSPLAGCDEIAALNQGLVAVAGVLGRKTAALENALHGIAEVDPGGCYVWRNRMYGEIAGAQQPSDFRSTFQPADRSRLEEAIARMRATGRAEIAVRLDQRSGPSPDVGLTLLAAPAPAAPAAPVDSGFYLFLRDIWGGNKTDAALVRAKEAAEASNRAKTEFLAKISHDIRTPLNAILGSADLLSQTPLSFDQSEYVSMFQRNCRRLVALINDFLDFSRIEIGAVRLDRGPYRIRETVGDAVVTFRETAARKGVELGVEIDPQAPACALGDPLRIQQILVNLLSNALKFTERGRVDVVVKVLSEASAGDRLRFEVSDTGPGIRQEDQDKIFARFVQLPGSGSSERGAGLGLTICRDLVTLMGGDIGVVSREGQGSTFYFNLPLEAVDPVAAGLDPAPSAPSELPSSQPIRILLAEDTEDNRLLMEHYLRGQPVQLRMALNGQEALDAVQQGEQFDLILMDIDMPVMDGHTAARRIRAWQQSQGQQQNALTPIVALSADAMQEAVRASLEAGCAAHVPKPVDRETLLATIRRFAMAKATPVARAMRSAAVSDQVLALVPQYLASKVTQIEEARASLASRDFGPIRRFGHNLKGTGRGYGFPPIEEMGREIERAAVEADAGRIASQLEALDRFVSESAAELADH